ncbi:MULTISPECIES: DUF4097 family beta strand repeat-containing protein [Cellulophaga]|uniref:Adhesin domain-containing protein n=2 Tax=Cellulophaga TaxID=104264 RepID=F0REU6_CELLC|nr:MULTISPECIES: DUF4097 family beta strand repeat-containing protein [Cellulophaga]ADY28901.1 hypothetical protein Celly_1072 [Cellulophaga lytica DSM 7489]EWH13277.1 hypothetical protein KLA_10148 [Cellulophaga geojensis KL-A]MDO6854460.1 DUF4097 family beta strand repeat-containing protein [Cellulophaga lytica]WQG76923.1 DUF4097 family beta strand repeat-containing protein [Cellulophaga lytica]
MKTTLYILLLISFGFLNAQKVVEKTVLNDHISLINIDTENCYQVTLETGKNEDVIVSANIEGEYKKDLVLEIKEEAASIFITTGFSPTFSNPNDKLSAHKVISISLHIIVPQYKNVKLYGKSSNIIASGNYKNLNITLLDGYCALQNITETITATTQSGNILVKSNNAVVKAATKYGKIHQDKLAKGNTNFNLSSITGDIHISKTK